MALVVPATVNDGPLFAEVDMGADSSALTVRATVVQASTVFYDTPATLGSLSHLYSFLLFPQNFIFVRWEDLDKKCMLI